MKLQKNQQGPSRQNKSTGSCSDGSNQQKNWKTNNIKKSKADFTVGEVYFSICKAWPFLFRECFETDPVARDVSSHRASLKHTLEKKGRAFRNIGKYTSLTVKSALLFLLDYLNEACHFCTD